MVSRILVDGYKSIDRIELELKGFTLLSGINSAGKSSVIQALLYMIQRLKLRDNGERGCEYVDLGRFPDIKNNVKGNKKILFEIDTKDGAVTSKSGVTVTIGEGFSLMELETELPEDKRSYVTTHHIVYLPTDRIGVEKAYDLNTEKPQEIGNHGEYTYSFLGMFGQEKIPEEAFACKPETVGMSLNNQVNYWLEYLTGFHIQTNIVSDIDQVVATYANAKSNRYYRARNVGTGVTYIATLLIAALSCKVDDALIIENPEIHLHPRAQSRLVEFLAYVSNLGLQVILETHSDHIYNGLRKCIKKEKIMKDKAAIYFFELDETMQTRVYDIKLNSQGAEENHPYGLFDQFDDDLDELLGM
ncbi:MAG: DUF3696 domain-containing protein [Ruminococcus sp.]|nr:DUF3696 domain-containing protein [Ruminococcus sp.]